MYRNSLGKCRICGLSFMRKSNSERYCVKCETKTCIICGKEFKQPLSLKAIKCCSSRCANESKKTGGIIKCEICGKEFYVLKNALGSRRYCSNKCKAVFIASLRQGKPHPDPLMGQKQMGDKNPNWYGGVNKQGYSYTFRRIKKDIKKRDNYTCQHCGEHLGDLTQFLDVHHRDFNKNNYEPSNLISLCKVCHARYYPRSGDIHVSE